MRTGRRIVALAAAAAFAAGCAYRVDVGTLPAAERPPGVRFEAPLVLERIRAVDWAGEGEAGAGFVQLVAMGFRASGLFTSVLEPPLSAEAPDRSLWLALRVHEHYPSDVGGNEAKLLVAAATLLLASPLLRFSQDVETTLEAEARTPSGWRKTYRVETKGRVDYGFYSDEPGAIDELSDAAISASFDSLVAQLAADAELAAALAAPPAGGPDS